MFQLTPMMMLGIGLSAVASAMIGAAWYGALGKLWMEAAGLTEERLTRADGGKGAPPILYATSFAANLVMAAILVGIMHHSGGLNVRVGLISAALCWVGFVATTTLVNNAFQMKPLALTLIDAGYWLLVLLAMGTILGMVGA
jgi:hypothetical protein